MARRRRIRGTPLLIAGTGVGVSVACGGGPGGLRDTFGPVGNLMAPPQVEVCVDVAPADAQAVVKVDGAEVDRCTTVWGDRLLDIRVEADGYEPHVESVFVGFDPAPITRTVTLVPEGE